jgi:hypothetical protein
METAEKKVATKFDLSRFNPDPGLLSYYSRFATFEDFWRSCPRALWMFWVAEMLGVDDRLLTKAKVKCVNAVRRLMVDPRSTAAVDAALLYANGKIRKEELLKYHQAAVDAISVKDNAAISAAKIAAADATDITSINTVVYAVSAAVAAGDANNVAATRESSLRKIASIYRKEFTKAVLEKVAFNHSLDTSLRNPYDEPRNRNTIEGVRGYVKKIAATSENSLAPLPKPKAAPSGALKDALSSQRLEPATPQLKNGRATKMSRNLNS